MDKCIDEKSKLEQQLFDNYNNDSENSKSNSSSRRERQRNEWNSCKPTVTFCANDDDDDDDDGNTNKDHHQCVSNSEEQQHQHQYPATGAVKRFDDLYNEVCEELKKNGKSIDLCEKLKTCGQQSEQRRDRDRAAADEEEEEDVEDDGDGDLKRIHLVISYVPSILLKFTNSIEKFYDAKDEWRAEELLLFAKSMANKESDKAIKVLNNALRLVPIQQQEDEEEEGEEEGMKRSGVEEDSGSKKLTHDKLCLEWFLAFSASSEEQQPQDVEQETQSVQSVRDHNSSSDCSKSKSRKSGNHKGKDKSSLVAQIYKERARRFNYTGEHESCILDIFTSIYYGAEKTFEIVSCLATSYKDLRRFEEANLLLQHSITMLRQSSWTNERKSELTLQIVKQLKETKSMNRTDDDDNGCDERTRDMGKINEIAIFMGPIHNGEASQVPPQDIRQKGIDLRSDSKPHLSSHSQPTNSSSSDQRSSIKSMKLYCGSSPQLIAASDVLQLKYNSQFGRHLIAKKTIPPGETLILESPYVWSLYPNMYEDFCQQCCKKAKSWVPCQHCSAVVFCSWKCRREAEYAHKFECPILKLLVNSTALGEMALLCYRTITNTSFPTLLLQKQFPKKMTTNKFEVVGKKMMTETEAAATRAGTAAATVDEESKHKIANTIGHENDGNRNNCQSQNSSQTSSSENDISLTETKKEGKGIRLLLGLNSFGQLDPSDYVSIQAQETNTEKRPQGDILKRILAAIYLMLCLRFTGFFDYHQSSSSKCQPAPTTENNREIDSSMTSRVKREVCQNEIDDANVVTSSIERDPTTVPLTTRAMAMATSQMEMSDIELHITVLLFRHLQSTSCNAYGINYVDKTVSTPMHMKTMEIGGCTYPTVSLTNHSCNPNVYRYSVGKMCIVKSILEIEKGEQILDSYGPVYSANPKHERQQHLKSNYFFKCVCTACINDWPVYSELNDNCSSAVGMKKKNLARKYGGKGSKQKSKVDLQQLQREAVELESKFQQYKQWLINGENGNEKIRLHYTTIELTISRYISVLQKLYQFPDKRLVSCQETLKILWNLFSPSS